jgi:hypothetical protein
VEELNKTIGPGYRIFAYYFMREEGKQTGDDGREK